MGRIFSKQKACTSYSVLASLLMGSRDAKQHGDPGGFQVGADVGPFWDADFDDIHLSTADLFLRRKSSTAGECR